MQILKPRRESDQTTSPGFNDCVPVLVDENEAPTRKVNVVRVEVQYRGVIIAVRVWQP